MLVLVDRARERSGILERWRTWKTRSVKESRIKYTGGERISSPGSNYVTVGRVGLLCAAQAEREKIDRRRTSRTSFHVFLKLFPPDDLSGGWQVTKESPDDGIEVKARSGTRNFVPGMCRFPRNCCDNLTPLSPSPPSLSRQQVNLYK